MESMTNESHIRAMLEEILDSRCTPEEACAESPELLPDVPRLKQLRSVESQLDELFPRRAPRRVTTRDRGRGLREPHCRRSTAISWRASSGTVAWAWSTGCATETQADGRAEDAAGRGVRESAELVRFLREAEAVAGLAAPEYRSGLRRGRPGGRPYFTMEFVEAGKPRQRTDGCATTGATGRRAGHPVGRCGPGRRTGTESFIAISSRPTS